MIVCVQLCGPGNIGPGGQCEPCIKGTYKTFSGPGNCTKCPANTYSNATGAVSNDTCVLCPEFYGSLSGAQDESACKCQPGRGGTDCLPCQFPLFKDSFGPQECVVCPENSVYKSPSQCMCIPGYTGSYKVRVCVVYPHGFAHLCSKTLQSVSPGNTYVLQAHHSSCVHGRFLLYFVYRHVKNAQQVPTSQPTAARLAPSALKTTTRRL